MKYKKYFLATITLLLIFVICSSLVYAKQELDENKVYIVPVKGVINKGLEQFVKRELKAAKKEKVKAIVFEIDTPGGQVQSAINISNAIINTSIPTISFINNEATSAGVIVAISCDKIYMSPNSTIGAAETRPKEEKYISYWSSKLESVAETTGRDPKLVAAMADADIEIKGVIEKGKILSLTTREATRLGLADGVAENYKELLTKEKLEDSTIIKKDKRPVEKFAQIIMDPYITPIILTVGFVGIITEILTPGFGLPGIIGIIALGLFFGAGIMIETAQYWMIGLFILGVLLLVIEIFIPGFGVFGVSGIICCILSIMSAFYNTKQALISLIFALITSCFIIYLLLKYIIKTPALNKLILKTKQEKSKGYTTIYLEDIKKFLGKSGITLTALRPSGMAVFDGKKLDVISKGEFIPEGKEVIITKVEGSKIIVKRKECDD